MHASSMMIQDVVLAHGAVAGGFDGEHRWGAAGIEGVAVVSDPRSCSAGVWNLKCIGVREPRLRRFRGKWNGTYISIAEVFATAVLDELLEADGRHGIRVDGGAADSRGTIFEKRARSRFLMIAVRLPSTPADRSPPLSNKAPRSAFPSLSIPRSSPSRFRSEGQAHASETSCRDTKIGERHRRSASPDCQSESAKKKSQPRAVRNIHNELRPLQRLVELSGWLHPSRCAAHSFIKSISETADRRCAHHLQTHPSHPRLSRLGSD